jgi:SAM-dependent methyltransferase
MTTIWAQGDYPAVAKFLTGAGEAVVRAAGITAHDTVLDVACGDGNAARVAARTGARVTGLDITPELLAAGRALAPEIEWVEGDAQALPFPDAHFDVVISTFGCMFAPDQRATASEMLRVLAPGGRLAIACWTPDGSVGDFFATIGRHAPPAPGEPPGLWGTEEHVRELLGDVHCEQRVLHFAYPSPEYAATFYFECFGPILAVRAIAQDEQALLADLKAFFRAAWDDGWDAEYLLSVRTGRSAGPT